MKIIDNFENLQSNIKQLHAKLLESELGINMSKGLIQLENLAHYYILNAFFVDMEWNPKIGTQFTTGSFINEFKLDRNHKLLINTLLRRVQEIDSILKCAEPGNSTSTWIVINLKPTTLEIRQKLKELQTLLLDFPEFIAEVNLLTNLGSHLYGILRGRVDRQGLLFPSAANTHSLQFGLPDYYENSTLLKHFKVSYMKEALCQVVKIWRNDEPNLHIKILEIGGGNGRTTFSILKELTHLMAIDNASAKVEYTFTYISTFFVSKAKAKLQKNFETVDFEFKLLDIEKDPIEQGYNEGHYDIIIAADVFHATRYLDDTIKHTRKLLKSNGILILGEIFQSSRFFECTFGLTDGWWRFSDFTLRENVPLISAEEWNKILRKYGYAKTFDVGLADHGVVFASPD